MAEQSDRENMIAARDLIRARRYDEARALLRTVSHPTARDWLAKLDEIAPSGPESASSPPFTQRPTRPSAPSPSAEEIAGFSAAPYTSQAGPTMDHLQEIARQKEQRRRQRDAEQRRLFGVYTVRQYVALVVILFVVVTIVMAVILSLEGSLP